MDPVIPSQKVLGPVQSYITVSNTAHQLLRRYDWISRDMIARAPRKRLENLAAWWNIVHVRALTRAPRHPDVPVPGFDP